jgi:hypothetical protein
VSYFHNDPDRRKKASLWVWFIAVSLFVAVDSLGNLIVNFMMAWSKLLR